MANSWRKAVEALGLRFSTPPAAEAAASAGPAEVSDRVTEEESPAGTEARPMAAGASSESTCAICLDSMEPGQGQALFSAECSHTFHFKCIASSVHHGNRVCPICRAQWKDIPFQRSTTTEISTTEISLGGASVNQVNPHQENNHRFRIRIVNNSSNQQQRLAPPLTYSEPTFDDDEPLDVQGETSNDSQYGCTGTVDIKTYTEFSAIPCSATQDNFAILIHLKAPTAALESSNLSSSQSSRAPVDLVTVLDISGSMSGTKLALLKRAMGFVIQNLGPADRLSVISFSSAARRLFPLRLMTAAGRQYALQAVNSLKAGGGTNITEGLRMGAKVMEECKAKNPVCSIILLSDGQDTYTLSYSSSGGARHEQPDNRARLLSSMRGGTGHQIPVHAFGFGTDHDSALMHSISEVSGGTFSFIEDEGVIQDAFAQCIGGLLSVVAQEMQVVLECMHSGVSLASIKSGSYVSRIVEERKGSVDVGCLYADEERDFLVFVNVLPAELEEMTLLRVGCAYRDPVSKEMVTLSGEEVRIQRPEVVASQTVSLEVDRERIRIQAVEAMAEARAIAERGDLSHASSILEGRRSALSGSLSVRSGDRSSINLDAELREMQERMASRQRYESSGRAYLLSGLNSHELQRATARMSSTGLAQAYETPSMTQMLERSQTVSPSPPSSGSFPGQPQPR